METIGMIGVYIIEIMDKNMETTIVYTRTLLVPLIGDIWSLIMGT